MLTVEQPTAPAAELAERHDHVKLHVQGHRLPVNGLGADSQAIDLEKPIPDDRGQINALPDFTLPSPVATQTKLRKNDPTYLAPGVSDGYVRLG